MLRSILFRSSFNGGSILASSFSTSSSRPCLIRRKLPDHKVCIVGATGTLGKQIALLLKLLPSIAQLSLYDDSEASLRLASLISQLSTRTKAVGYWGEDGQGLGDALAGSQLVIVTAGVPTPETSSEHLHKFYVGFIRALCTDIVKHCPRACVHMVSNPTRSLQVAKEVFKKAGTYDSKRLIGVLSDHVGATRPRDPDQNEDIWSVKEEGEDDDNEEEGREPGGLEMFQGAPEDAMAIAYASLFCADQYLSSPGKSSWGFPFTDTAYTDQIKQIYKSPLDEVGDQST